MSESREVQPADCKGTAILLGQISPVILKSLLSKMKHSDLLNMGKTSKWVSNFILDNASKFPNRRKIKCTLRYPMETERFRQRFGHLPGKLDIDGVLEIDGRLNSEPITELHRHFQEFCRERDIRVHELRFNRIPFFVKALQATRAKYLSVHTFDEIDSEILNFEEVQNATCVTIHGLEIARLNSMVKNRNQILDVDGFMQLNLGVLNSLLKNLEKGVFTIVYHIYRMSMLSPHIDASNLDDMLDGLNATLYWAVGRQNLPLSHKPTEQIRRSAIAVFTIENKGYGSTIMVRIFTGEVTVETLNDSAPLLFQAWDAIRNSSSYPL